MCTKRKARVIVVACSAVDIGKADDVSAEHAVRRWIWNG